MDSVKQIVDRLGCGRFDLATPTGWLRLQRVTIARSASLSGNKLVYGKEQDGPFTNPLILHVERVPSDHEIPEDPHGQLRLEIASGTAAVTGRAACTDIAICVSPCETVKSTDGSRALAVGDVVVLDEADFRLINSSEWHEAVVLLAAITDDDRPCGGGCRP